MREEANQEGSCWNISSQQLVKSSWKWQELTKQEAKDNQRNIVTPH